MSTATSYSKLGHLALAKETTAGTAVYPSTFLELLSEDLVVNWDHTPSEAIAGNRSANQRAIKNRIEPATGTIDILVEPNTFGHILTGTFGAATDSTLEASTVWQHLFEPENTLQTYTMDIKAGGQDYVTRYFGVRFTSQELKLNNNKLTLSIGVTAQRAFTNARVTTAASSGTALVLDQTSGLTTSDTLTLIDASDMSEHQDLTIATITNETTLVVSTISQSLAVNDIAVIAAQTPTYSLSNEFIWSGGAQVSIANGANGVQNLSTYTNLEDFTLSITNDVEPRWAATGNDVIDRFPANILLKGMTVEGSLIKFNQNSEFLDILRQQEQSTLRIEFLGTALSSNSAAAAAKSIETDGSGTVDITVDASGEAGNDYAVVFTSGNASLTASLSGKLITVNLDTVAANNTTTLVSSAINALSGVSCATTGADLVTVADNLSKIHFAAGRDANEIEKLRFDLPNVIFKPFNVNLGSDDVLQEEIEFTAFRDSNDSREIEVLLRNGTSAY